MKRKKRNTKLKFKVVYEYVPSPDAEERVNRAFDMLFDEVEKTLTEEQIKKERRVTLL